MFLKTKPAGNIPGNEVLSIRGRLQHVFPSNPPYRVESGGPLTGQFPAGRLCSAQERVLLR